MNYEEQYDWQGGICPICQVYDTLFIECESAVPINDDGTIRWDKEEQTDSRVRCRHCHRTFSFESNTDTVDDIIETLYYNVSA